MAALLRSYCRIRTGIARVLCLVSTKDRHPCFLVPVGSHISSKPVQTIDTRNWQVIYGRQHENFSLQHVRHSDSTSPEIWTKSLIFTLRQVLHHKPRNVSYENVLAIVMDLKNKVKEGKMSFKLSAELGRELLDIIVGNKHMSTVQKSNLTSLLWKIINSLCDFECDESLYTSYVMACSESNIQISIPEIRQKMADSGLQSNVDFLQAALSYHCSVGEVDEGCQILEQMKDAGMTVNSHCFKCLVTAYAKTGLVSADDMLDIMRKHNIKQDLDTYGAMLQFHATLGDMDAIEKTLQKFEDEDFAEMDDKIMVQLHIFLPLLQNRFQEEANKAIGSFCIPAKPSLEVNQAVDKCAHSLLLNGYLEEAFQLYCKPSRRGRKFLHDFLHSEEAKKADSIVRGVKLSVKLLQESRIDLEKLFKDSSLSSIAFLMALMKELKELKYVKNSSQLKQTLSNVRHCNWKTLVLTLADLNLPTLEARASEELARHVKDPHYGTHSDCVKRILEKTLYQDEAAALDMYRKLIEKEHGQDPRQSVIESSAASYIQDMYLKLGRYRECQQYLKVMIEFNPAYAGHLTKVLSCASVMLKNGHKDGVMETIDYFLKHMNRTSGTLYVPGVLPEILIQLIPPDQAFSCLKKINVHKLEHNRGMNAKLMRLYMEGNDADLLAEAYIAFLKTSKMPATIVKTNVMCQLMEDGREDLVQEGGVWHCCEINLNLGANIF
ncbi:uncharacterized protein LOC110445428 isoform X2 [Mizuhopecten yessoensis]|uniref:uncharacterized protein LOC110445428 isoform X2 n=1 Tax=Mizuhopecten yessoensis TaxID=6573 RepID=UPI000B45F509|nr:uncharacterized protein LOC110445428 isoform X2 [Mizuhopecten yessoensis]